MNRLVAVAHAVSPTGLPLHDLIAYIAAAIAVLACVLAIVGTREVIKRQREIKIMYQSIIEHICSEEAARRANREELARERELHEIHHDSETLSV